MYSPMEMRAKMLESRRTFFGSNNSDTEVKNKPKTPRKRKAPVPVISTIKTRSQIGSIEQKEIDTHPDNVKEKPIPRENSYGHIEGVPVGAVFATRLDCSRSGVHRPTVAGIHGNDNGCYSIVVSGGYEDGEDQGDTLIYTGSGGRDLKGTPSKVKNLRTAPQSKNQELIRGNLSLSESIKNKTVVRVVRGYKGSRKYAPLAGYRYDGLYYVVSFNQVMGKSGFMVYKFKLQRCEDQEPGPWEMEDMERE